MKNVSFQIFQCISLYNIIDNNQTNGGICISEGTLYVIVEETVKKKA